MAGAFDPYRQLLGIHHPERPPNFYRLAGVEPFEADPITIAQAADRQMEQLRYHQSGPQAVDAQRILQEVIAAKLCLLDPQRKAEYDAWLRSQPSTASTIPAAPVTGFDGGYPEPAATMPAPLADAPLSTTVKAIIGALSGVIVVLLVLIGWMATRRTPPAVEPAAPVATVRPATDKSSGRPSPPTVFTPAAPPPPTTVTDAMPKGQSEELPAGATPASEEATNEPVAASPAPATDPPSVAAETLRAVREALAKRDLMTANEQLVLAASQVTAAELMELNRLRDVLASLSVFWRAVRSGMAELKPGESLDVKRGKLTVVRATTEELVVKSGSRELRYTVEGMPAALALLLAERKLPDVPASRLAKATFLTFDPQGDKLLARQWCDQAAKEGLSVAALLAELGPAAAASETPEAPEKKSEKKPPKTPGQKPSKLALPDPAAEAAALAEVRKIHRNDFEKAQDPAKKKALARTLLKEALETPDEPAIRFVLLGQARDLAVIAGDSALLREVVEETAKYYDVDAKEQLIRILSDVADSRVGTSSKKDLAQGTLDLAHEYLAAHDYDSAMRLARAAQSMALGRDTAMTKQAVDLIKSLPRLEQEYERFQQAGRILADDPNHASANLVQGQYYCFVQNTEEAWQKGLPMLAKGSDAKLKALAEAELALARSKSKQDANDWFNLAEQWYEMARSVDDIARASCRSRAASWYEKAQPKLQGFKARKAKLRLEELRK